MCCFGLALTAGHVGRGEETGLSGEYADDGVVLSGAAEQFPHGVSLHALLNLEFDPGLARQLHEQTSRISVRQENGVLEIKIHDHDGDVSKQGRWRKEPSPGDRIFLRFHTPTEDYFLQLEPVSHGQLLQVSVQRSTVTFLGPAFTDVGVFLFPRIL
jgi:hypothetical protein